MRGKGSLYEVASPPANSASQVREVLLGLNQSPGRLPRLPLLMEILLNILRMIEVVRDRAVDIAQGERREVLLDLLGSRTVLKLVDD